MKPYLTLSAVAAALLLSCSASAELRYAKPVDDTPTYAGASYDHVNVSHYRLNTDVSDNLSGWGVSLEKRVNAQWFVSASHVDVDHSDNSNASVDRTLLGLGHIVTLQDGVTLDAGISMGRVRFMGDSVDVIQLSAGVRQRVGRVDWRITPMYSDYDLPRYVDISEFSVLVGANYFVGEQVSLGAQATLSGDYKLFGLGVSYHF